MENYYLEMIAEIEDCIEKEAYEEALFLVKKELSMPYIPRDSETRLLQLQKELKAKQSIRASYEKSTAELLAMLKGKPESQLLAVNQLASRNLREVLEEVRDWLQKDPQKEAASLMIEALSNQEIDEEFELVKDGVTYTFYAQDVIPVVKSDGFRYAKGHLERMLVHYPQYYEMAKHILVHECYVFLPLSYERSDALGLCKLCTDTLYSLTQDEQLLKVSEEYFRHLAHLS